MGLAHDLNLNTLGANVVEHQLATGRALGEDTTANADNGIGLLFALLETFVVLQDIAQIGVDLELVGVGVWLLGLAQLVDLLAPNFEILLYMRISPNSFSGRRHCLQVIQEVLHSH